MNISKYMEDRTGSLRDGVQVWGCGDGMQALVPELNDHIHHAVSPP